MPMRKNPHRHNYYSMALYIIGNNDLPREYCDCCREGIHTALQQLCLAFATKFVAVPLACCLASLPFATRGYFIGPFIFMNGYRNTHCGSPI